MGALSLVVNNRGVMGDLRYAEVSATFSSSYATGGDTGLTAAALGWDSVLVGIATSQDAGYHYEYIMASGNMRVWEDDNVAAANAAHVEVANTTDLSTTPGAVRMFIMGR